MQNIEIKYWIVVVSKDHIEIGKKLGIIQANHGKAAPMKRLNSGDFVVIYSPKIVFSGKELCQKFTAVACIQEGDVYKGDMGGGFTPYRRDAQYLPCKEIDIKPLLQELTFIKKKESWGAIFRFGFFEIPKNDFETIAREMGILK